MDGIVDKPLSHAVGSDAPATDAALPHPGPGARGKFHDALTMARDALGQPVRAPVRPALASPGAGVSGRHAPDKRRTKEQSHPAAPAVPSLPAPPPPLTGGAKAAALRPEGAGLAGLSLSLHRLESRTVADAPSAPHRQGDANGATGPERSHDVPARSFGALAEQAQSQPMHAPDGLAVQFPESGWAVSGLDVNVLPDGAVDVVLSVDRQSVHDVSNQLDRLRRRLEARGLSVAGLQLDAGAPVSAAGDGEL